MGWENSILPPGPADQFWAFYRTKVKIYRFSLITLGLLPKCVAMYCTFLEKPTIWAIGLGELIAVGIIFSWSKNIVEVTRTFTKTSTTGRGNSEKLFEHPNIQQVLEGECLTSPLQYSCYVASVFSIANHQVLWGFTPPT